MCTHPPTHTHTHTHAHVLEVARQTARLETWVHTIPKRKPFESQNLLRKVTRID